MAPDLKVGTLVEVVTDDRSLDLGVHAVNPTRQHVSPKGPLMINYLAQQLRKPAWVTAEL